MGRVDGWDGNQKCPLIFFILRYIKHYTHIYTYTYKKKFADKFFVVVRGPIYLQGIFNLNLKAIKFFCSNPQLDQNLKPTRNLCGQLLYIYLCIYVFSV